MPTIISGDNGVDKIIAGSVQFDDVSAGMVIQVVPFVNRLNSSGTATIPWDDTIPQITEGTQFLTATFTPKKANSKLKIDVILTLNASANIDAITALFRDSNVNAIEALVTNHNVGNSPRLVVLSTIIDAISTTPSVFTVRAGGASASTVYINGYTSRYLGGSQSSSITITEIAQ